MIGNLEDYRALVKQCSHCSLCEAVCPVYLEDLLETHVARARVDLIGKTLYEKSMPVTARVRDIVGRCLLCTRCTQTCGAAVPVHEIILTARHELGRGGLRGLGGVAEAVRRVFLKRMMEDKGLRGLPALLIEAAQKLGLAPEGFPAVRFRPPELRAGTRPAEGTKRARVVYFAGCSHALDPETAASVLKVLARNGIEAVVPEGLTCCGLPALAQGDLETARRMVRNNIAILAAEQADAVVTDCTSCGMVFRSEALKTLPPDDPAAARALEVSRKVFEVTDYLNTLGLAAAPGALDETYTYHVPCHSGWAAGVADAPLQLLAKIPRARYAAMADPEKCCGAGGTFFMEYADLSGKIRSGKLRDVAATGAGFVISQCPACRSYLSAGLTGGQGAVSAVHPVTLLCRAYEG
ncbi:MAG: (Fe-S)-binding protein [bacterium]